MYSDGKASFLALGAGQFSVQINSRMPDATMRRRMVDYFEFLKTDRKAETCIECHQGIAHELPEGIAAMRPIE